MKTVHGQRFRDQRAASVLVADCQSRRRPRWLLLVLVLVLQLPGAATGEAGDFPYTQPYFESVGDTDSVPSGVVTSLAEASDGQLWIGTQTGLLRYHGQHFEQYLHDPGESNSLAGNHVTALATLDRRILVGTANDGLSIYDPVALRFEHFRHRPNDPHSLFNDQILSLAVEDRRLWVGTTAGLAQLDLQSGRFTALTLPLPAGKEADSRRILSLLLDARGTLWIGTRNGLLLRAAGETAAKPLKLAAAMVSSNALPTPVDGAGDESEPFAGESINALFAAADGTLWIGTREHGVARLSQQGQRLQRVNSRAPSGAYTLATDRIQDFVQTRPGQVWVATTVGIHVLHSETLVIEQQWNANKHIPGSLAAGAIGATLRDRSGLVWVGTWGAGLQRIWPDNRAFRTIRLDAAGKGGLSFADVHAVLERADGTLWVGNGGNGIDLIDPERGRIGGYRPEPGNARALGDGVVIALEDAGNDQVWVGTQRGGLFRANSSTGQFTPVGQAGTVTDLHQSVDGTLWVGGSRGVERLRAGSDQLEPMHDQDGQPMIGPIIPIDEDAQGRIWVGTGDGLRVLAPGATRFSSIRHEADRADSLVHDAIYGLLLDREDQLWVATEQGVVRLRDWDGKTARFDRVSERLGQPGRGLGANLLQDARGRIWTDEVVIDPANNSIYRLTRADGVAIGTSWFGSHAQLRDGRFLQGGTEGLLLIDPEAFDGWNLEPKVIATELRINGLVAPPDLARGLVLQTDQRTFSMEFAALDLTDPQALRYRHRLQGFDQKWIETDAKLRRASYSNLWPGDYLLQVEGSNRVGRFSPHRLTVPLRVLPHVWQTRTFAALCTLLLAALLTLAWRWRVHRMQQRERELDAEVAARTAALAASNAQLTSANGELERARQELENAQAQLIFQEKMASLGELVAGVAHEVNTPLGIAITASTFLEQRSSELSRLIDTRKLQESELRRFAAEVSESSGLVFRHLDRAAQLVRQFKQVSVDRTLDERRKVGLDQLLGELLSSLGPLLKRQSVKLRFEGAPDVVLNTYPGAIGQILMNLVQNACTHAFEACSNPEVRVEAEAETRPDGQCEITLRVSDNGCGMQESIRRRVFEPFFTTRRNRGGTGLGLHIVFNLVHAHLGGNIEVLSTPGRGSTFSVRFPADSTATRTDGARD